MDLISDDIIAASIVGASSEWISCNGNLIVTGVE
jgi:hypothetical protein